MKRMGRLVLLIWLCGATLAARAQRTEPLAYEVASVKVNKAGNGMMSMRNTPDGYSGVNVVLQNLILNAWGLKTASQLVGLPGWGDTTGFDVATKMDAETLEALKKLPLKEATAERQRMMRAVLEERFELKVHHETREMPMYALVAAKSGTRLKAANSNEVDANGKGRPGGMSFSPGVFKATGITPDGLAGWLGSNLNRQVVDRTGLTGNYDLELKWSPEGAQMDGADPQAGAGPSLFTALEEQLGLRLEAIKGPVDVVVVDHVQMPSQN